MIFDSVYEPPPLTPLPDVAELPHDDGWHQWDIATRLLDATQGGRQMKVIKTTNQSDLERQLVGVVVIACVFTVVAVLVAVFA